MCDFFCTFAASTSYIVRLCHLNILKTDVAMGYNRHEKSMKKVTFFIMALAAVMLSACSSTPSKPNECDQLLDQYEAVVDSVVMVGQQVDKSDLNSVMEYSAVVQRAGEKAQEISNHATEMSMDQANRLQDITKKLQQSASEFQQKMQ